MPPRTPGHLASPLPPTLILPLPPPPRSGGRLRRRTFRLNGFVAVTTAAKAGAVLMVVCYFFGGALLFWVLAIGSYCVLMEYSTRDERRWGLAELDRRLANGLGGFDDALRLAITKLAAVWHSLVALHKSAVDYSFTVSIEEAASLADLSDVLAGRIKLLGGEEGDEPPGVNSANRLIPPSSCHVWDSESAVRDSKRHDKPRDLKMTVQHVHESKVLQRTSALVPVTPAAAAIEPKRKKRLSIIHVPLPSGAKQPLPRLIIVKPWPSQLTLPQSVARMLAEVERMDVEARALATATDALLRQSSPDCDLVGRSRSPRPARRKSVRFSEDVTHVDAAPLDHDADHKRLFYCQEELDEITEQFFQHEAAAAF